MRVLLSAYACEPGKGSEPEIGWQWAVHLGKICEVTVITRTNNREAIEKALEHMVVPNLQFVYIDLSSFFRFWKSNMRPRALAVMFYYVLWQYKARRKISELLKVDEYDVLHHSTFGAFRLPFAVSGHGLPCVVGPVGGCENFPPELFPDKCYRIRFKEGFRNFLNWLCKSWGVGMSSYSNVDSVLACTKEMHQLFLSRRINSTMMPNIGMLPLKDQPVSKSGAVERGLKLLFVGRIYYWKGLELAITAMTYLPDNVSLTIVGEGPDLRDLMKLIARKNLAHRVNLVGKMFRDEVINMYKESDLFLFPSIHDSGGFVVLEAMAASLPVICLDRGGPALSVNNQCGHVISSGSRKQTVDAVCMAVNYYIDQPEQLVTHGKAARERVRNEYAWSKKSKEMLQVYLKTIENYE